MIKKERGQGEREREKEKKEVAAAAVVVVVVLRLICFASSSSSFKILFLFIPFSSPFFITFSSSSRSTSHDRRTGSDRGASPVFIVEKLRERELRTVRKNKIKPSIDKQIHFFSLSFIATTTHLVIAMGDVGAWRSALAMFGDWLIVMSKKKERKRRLSVR